jgi:two-component system response regulator VanR
MLLGMTRPWAPGSGISAERLLQQVWDENADPFSQTVKMTISRLRRKLGEPPIIHTSPAIGYRLSGNHDEA